MSTDIIAGNALQFTNDNKKAYMYSGPVSVPVGGAKTTLVQGSTNSEYLHARFNFSGTETTDNFTFTVTLNDVEVVHIVLREPYDIIANGYEFIIPPFTTIKISAENKGGVADRNAFGNMSATVGMAQRVGNLNE